MRTGTKGNQRGVTKLRDGLFLIRIQTKDPRTGMPVDVRRRVRCRTAAEAAAEQSKLLVEVQTGRETRERVRLREYAASWMTGRLPSLKASTRRRYADGLDRHILPALGDFYLDMLKPEDVHAWFASAAQESAPATVNGYLRLLKTIMRDAVSEHGLPRDPTARTRAIPERRRAELESDEPVNMLSSEELGKFLATLKARHPQWYALVFTQFATARRFGEVSALRWEDIDWDRGRIRVRRAQWRTIVDTPKTDRAVTVPLTEELRDVLQSWRQELLGTQHRHIHTGWVFPSRAGKPHHNASCMRKAFVDCLQEMGLARRFSSHGLRRTANDLLRRVATAEVTRAITGHVTAAMTEHYSHVDPAEKKAAVEGMLRLVQSATQPSERNRHIGRHTDVETGTNENGRSLNRPKS